NLLVLRSLTKCFAIPGLRVGLAIGAESVLRPLRQDRPCWELGTLEQAVASACLRDQQYVAESREQLRQWRAAWARDLAELPGCQVVPGQANWHLLKLPVQHDADSVVSACLRQGVALRSGAGIGDLGPAWLRIAVRRPEENERCLQALRQVLGGAPALRRPRRTPALMLQGCSSDAGKSLLTAGICRIMLQDGFDVAPFKAQNMANNAGVTRDGLEIGRAQMLQAQACRLDADVRMNPVLLKPTGECGSQVVLMGQAHGSMDVQAYHRFTEAARATALAAYDSLAAEHQVLVLEGAGSPGEVNLRGRDFVNMPMAQHAGAAVLLVGDIDRGGVYASLAGHCETFTPAERRLLAGFLINKFRGDETLLTPAHDWLERRTGVPVLGCVRHLGRHGLPEEDSLGLGSGWRSDATAELHITVVALPRLANASDCDPLAAEPDVALHLAARPEDLAGADCILLPGSKASLLDADWLQETGMAAAIRAAHGSGVLVIGICGGLQLLGRELTDPQAVESDGRPRAGLGLQPWCTAMAGAKIRRCTGARHRDGAILRGYEIHHGRTDWRGAAPLITADDGSVIGAGDEHCWGCYLHGCFDADAFRHAFLDDLRRRRGLPRLDGRPHVDLEPAIDALAAQVRASVDLAAIYERMGISTRRRARPSQTDDR
ncbi:MAG: cobyric acid synthase, partial [Planctomycetota bacterium]